MFSLCFYVCIFNYTTKKFKTRYKPVKYKVLNKSKQVYIDTRDSFQDKVSQEYKEILKVA
jgi:hypothetical protein